MFKNFVAGFVCFIATAAAAAAPVPIKVGVLVSRTGVMADIGAEGEHGFRLAMETLKSRFDNERYRVEFVFEDTRSSPDAAATAANKLINSDHVDVLVGDLTSTVTLAAAPIAQNAKIPLITPSATSDKVTQVGDYIFRACYVDSFQGIAMANYAYDTLKARKAALLVDTDVDHSRDVSRVFGEAFRKKGGTVLDTVSFSGSRDTSYVAQLTALRNLKADVIYAPVYYARMGIIFKQAKSFKITAQFIGTDAWDSPQLFKLAGGATDGALLTDPFSYENPDPRVQQFRSTFKKTFKEEPSSYGALAYDTIFVLDSALNRLAWPAQGALSQAIRANLATTQDVAGVTGSITLDKDRNVSKPDIVILRLKADGYTFKAMYNNKTP